MTTNDKKLLEDDGWKIDCESPFEISDKNGNRAVGRDAHTILSNLLMYCPECGGLNPGYKITDCDCKDTLSTPERLARYTKILNRYGVYSKEANKFLAENVQDVFFVELAMMARKLKLALSGSYPGEEIP